MSLFITFEGVDGSGKSTQARLLYQQMMERGYPVILTREPGGSRISEMIRRIVVDLQHTEMVPACETFLFAAARAQLVNELIRPYLATGGIVLCDRYADSTYAYQGYGLGRDMAELETITRIATGGLEPDMTLYLDMTAEEGLKRKQRVKQARQQRHERDLPAPDVMVSLPPMQPPATADEQSWNRIDARDLAYHKKVEEGFRALMQRSPARWQRIDACRSIEHIANEIATCVEPLLQRITLLDTPY